MLDVSKIYPYIVTPAYVEKFGPQPEGLTYPLGHGLSVTLVSDFPDLVGMVSERALTGAGLTPQEAHRRALANLVTSFRNGDIPPTRHDGPMGRPFILFSGHWLASACILLPHLHAFAAEHLSADRFWVCLPQREALLVFPAGDASFRTAMLETIRANESDARKPLSFGLFELDAAGFREIAGTV